MTQVIYKIKQHHNVQIEKRLISISDNDGLVNVDQPYYRKLLKSSKLIILKNLKTLSHY